MFRPALGAGALSCALLGALLSTTPAQAADMAYPAVAAEPVNEEPIEWGSNWYLRGQVGAAQNNVPSLNGANQSASFPNNWTAGLGGGYQFNSWLRGDVTVDYQSIQNLTNSSSLVAPCITSWAVDPTTSLYYAITDICRSLSRSRIETMAVLANAYLDLGNWYGFTPYIGGGLGVNVMYQKSQVNFYMPNGLSATQVWPIGVVPYYQNLDSQFQGTFLRFAYGLMGGVAYDIDNHWKIDVGYRWLNLGKIEGMDNWGQRIAKDLTTHQVSVGFRYVID